MYIKVFLLFTLLFLGCSVPQPTVQETNVKVRTLENLIVTLSPSIQKKEALDFAQGSIAYSYQLAKEYEVLPSPWWHNTFVNVGIKKRGLCHEWAEDLLRFLVQRDYKTLELHAVGANIGYFNEHNALSVSARGKGIRKSILLDAWRNSGNLYFIQIDKDIKYKWRERHNLYGILPPSSGKR